MVIAPIIRGVVKGVSTGMGLVGEKYYDRKDRKSALAEQEASRDKESIRELLNPIEPGAETADDERIWALDEAAGEPPSYEDSEAATRPPRPTADRTVSDLVHDFDSIRLASDTPIRLPYPIIIPQRRPGSKARGWASAYPPDLEAFGIEQDAFLHFLQSFQESSKADPWLNTLYISAGAVGFIPNHITMAVSISVQIAAGTAIELQSRYRANAFLDQMNKEIYMPRGLYCMVLLCKDGPGSAQNPEFGIQTVNLQSAKQVAQWGLPKENKEDEVDLPTKQKILRPIRLTSGKTEQSQMPLEIAPLVYPGLEDMIERPDIKRDESFKERLMRNKEFVADYFDRRSRANYMGNNPDAALTKASQEMPEFKTRFGDPNHPCNNGHLFSLVTGGHHVAQPRGRNSRLREKGPDGKLLPKSKQKHQIRGPISLVGHGVRKVMAPNILYLTVVNLPSEEELAEARLALGIDKKGIADMLKEMRAQ